MSSDFGDYEFSPGMSQNGERILSKALIADGTEVSAIVVESSAMVDRNSNYEVINIEGSNQVIIAIDKEFVDKVLKDAPSKAVGAYGLGVFVGQVVTDVARDLIENIPVGGKSGKESMNFGGDFNENDEQD